MLMGFILIKKKLSLVDATAAGSALGIATGVYYAPRLVISKHTQVPQWKATQTAPRPTGSVWIKTTEPNLGSRWRVKRWNEATLAWESVESPLYANGHEALAGLDKVGGGANLSVGQLYVQTNYTEDNGTDETPRLASWKIWRKGGSETATVIRSAKITDANTTAESKIMRIA